MNPKLWILTMFWAPALCSSVAYAGPSSPTWPAGWSATDADGDGVSDEFEEFLARRYRPVFYSNSPGCIRPGSLDYYLSHCSAMRGKTTVAEFHSAGEAADFVAKDPGKDIHLQATFDAEHAERSVPPDTVATVFYHVCRFDAAKQVYAPTPGYEYVNVQYFYFCYFNDADFPANLGDHEGDWCCVDLTLIVKCPAESGHPAATPREPLVDSALFHQHGRQAYANELRYHKLLFTDDGRLQIFLEENCNEPWPNPGGAGFAGWPVAPGFFVNHRWQKCQGIPSPEQECHIVHEHFGRDEPVTDYNLINLGEKPPAGTPMDKPLSRFVIAYQGLYGNYAPDLPPVYTNGPPPGPPFQPEMWERSFRYGDFSHYWRRVRPDSEEMREGRLDRRRR